MTCLVASSNSKWFATASQDGTIIVWDAECGTLAQEWLAHWGAVHALQFSPDGLRLISAGGKWGETLVVWGLRNSASKAAVLATIDTEKRWETAVCDSTWSPDGAWIASTYGDGTVRVWDASTFQERSLLSGNDSHPFGSVPLRQFQWSSDSCYLIWIEGTSPSDYLEWTVWEPLAEEPPKVLRVLVPVPLAHVEDFDTLSTVLFDPQGRRIAVAVCEAHHCKADHRASENTLKADGSSDRHGDVLIEIWDVMTGTSLDTLGHASGVYWFTYIFSPDGKSLLSILDDGQWRIWNTESWQETASLKGCGGGCVEACFSPDGKYVAITSSSSATDTFAVQLWRVGDTSHAAVFTEHKCRICDLAFSLNGEFLASGDDGGLVYIRRLSDYI